MANGRLRFTQHFLNLRNIKKNEILSHHLTQWVEGISAINKAISSKDIKERIYDKNQLIIITSFKEQLLFFFFRYTYHHASSMGYTKFYKFSTNSLRDMVSWLSIKWRTVLTFILLLLYQSLFPHRKWVNMATRIILSESKEEIPRNLLRHRKKITEGRDKTSWDIACSRKALLPITLENPWDKHGSRYKKNPSEPPYEQTTTSPPSNSVSETRAACSDKINWMKPQDRIP